ncbi:MAG TPA: PIN domain-containing protein [Edaphobacter sp.]|nr:PIN domain-containing protein [Edaphobacter sp.]
MILADTSVWVDHLRQGDTQLAVELNRNNILMHPYVAGELALGSLNQRVTVLTSLDLLPSAVQARENEVRDLIEQRGIYGRGIGYIDAHLLASVLLTPHAALWTRDKRLRKLAESLDLHGPFL